MNRKQLAWGSLIAGVSTVLTTFTLDYTDVLDYRPFWIGFSFVFGVGAFLFVAILATRVGAK